MNFQTRKKIGQLLREKSYLDETGLELGLAEQKTERIPLGRILVNHKYITQHQLNEVLALQAGIEKIDLTDVSISPQVITLVPAELVSKHSILPLRHNTVFADQLRRYKRDDL